MCGMWVMLGLWCFIIGCMIGLGVMVVIIGCGVIGIGVGCLMCGVIFIIGLVWCGFLMWGVVVIGFMCGCGVGVVMGVVVIGCGMGCGVIGVGVMLVGGVVKRWFCGWNVFCWVVGC